MRERGEEAVRRVAAEVCPGCADHLLVEGAWHVYSDGMQAEECIAERVQRALREIWAEAAAGAEVARQFDLNEPREWRNENYGSPNYLLSRDGNVDETRLDEMLTAYGQQLLSQQAERIARWCEVLKKACDREREWNDKTPDQIVTNAANVIHWREKRADRAEAQLREQAVELEAARRERDDYKNHAALEAGTRAAVVGELRRVEKQSEALEQALRSLLQAWSALRTVIVGVHGEAVDTVYRDEYKAMTNAVALAEAALPPEEAK